MKKIKLITGNEKTIENNVNEWLNEWLNKRNFSLISLSHSHSNSAQTGKFFDEEKFKITTIIVYEED